MSEIGLKEYILIKEFQDSLSEEEKNILRKYQQIMVSPKTENERRMFNIISMAYVEGYRRGKEKT